METKTEINLFNFRLVILGGLLAHSPDAIVGFESRVLERIRDAKFDLAEVLMKFSNGVEIRIYICDRFIHDNPLCFVTPQIVTAAKTENFKGGRRMSSPLRPNKLRSAQPFSKDDQLLVQPFVEINGFYDWSWYVHFNGHSCQRVPKNTTEASTFN